MSGIWTETIVAVGGYSPWRMAVTSEAVTSILKKVGVVPVMTMPGMIYTSA